MSLSRRRLLAGAGAVATSALAGCSERLWSFVEGSTTDRLSLHIKTPPQDDDPMAASIASQLAENLQAAGIDALPEPTAKPELFRSTLMAHDFDMFVTRHPGFDDPDALRPLLHSRLSGERGWQNPFGFSEPTVDEYLESQLRKAGESRQETTSDLVEYLLETVPYTVVAFPDHVGAADSSLTVSGTPRTPIEYASILYQNSPEDREDELLRAGTFTEGMTDRLNPIAVDLEGAETVLDLLYDPLVREVDDEYVPWLAEDVSWSETDSQTEAEVTLREGTSWHDGTSLGVEDVTFTTRFLMDTSLDEGESPVPAPRYRGRRSLIEDVIEEGEGRRTLRFVFDDVPEEVARRALTIPILPEHVWKPRSTLIDEHWTEALAHDNDEPVGSGLFAFVDSTGGERLELELFEDHVIFRDGVDGHSDLFDGTPEFDGIEFRISPRAGAAVENLNDGEIDLIVGWLSPSNLEELGDDVLVTSTPTHSCYLVGFNTRKEALSNHRFRRTVARLVDREHVVSEFFGGRATPAQTPSELLGLTEIDDEEPADLASFPGSAGNVDEAWVRSELESSGFHYENGELFV